MHCVVSFLIKATGPGPSVVLRAVCGMSLCPPGAPSLCDIALRILGGVPCGGALEAPRMHANGTWFTACHERGHVACFMVDDDGRSGAWAFMTRPPPRQAVLFRGPAEHTVLADLRPPGPAPTPDPVCDALAPASAPPNAATPSASASAAPAVADGSAVVEELLPPSVGVLPSSPSAASPAPSAPATPALADADDFAGLGALVPVLVGEATPPLADVFAIEQPFSPPPLPPPPLPLFRLIHEMAQPFRPVGLLALLGFSYMTRNPVRLFVLGSLIPLLETYMPGAVERMGGYLTELPMTLAICRTRRLGSSAEVVLPSSLQDVPLCNHYTPLVPTEARPSGPVHANCAGLRCGGAVGWPCISPLVESVAPMGYMPWPVPGDGDCLFHSILWLQGRDSLGIVGMSCRADLRRAIAYFLEEPAQAEDPLWHEAVPLLGEAIAFDVLPERASSSAARASEPHAHDNASAAPGADPSPAARASRPVQIIVDDDGLLTSDHV